MRCKVQTPRDRLQVSAASADGATIWDMIRFLLSGLLKLVKSQTGIRLDLGLLFGLPPHGCLPCMDWIWKRYHIRCLAVNGYFEKYFRGVI